MPYLERAEVLEGRDGRTWQWVPVPGLVLADRSVTPDMVAVYAGLGRHVHGRRTYVSVPRIQGYVGRARATVSAAVSALVDLGYVAVWPRPGRSLEYELRALPQVPADRLVLDPAARRWDHVRAPVVLLDDDRVDAGCFTLWAAAAWLSEDTRTAELDLHHLATVAGVASSRSGVRTIRARLDRLAHAGYLTLEHTRGRARIGWVPCPPVPKDHRIRPPVDARPSRTTTPSSGARSFDRPLLEASGEPHARERAPEGPHVAGQARLGSTENRALDDGVRAPGDGVPPVRDRAPDREVRAPDRELRAPDRGVRAPDRDDLDTPPSPFGREGGAGGEAHASPRPGDDRDAVTARLLDAARGGASVLDLNAQVLAATEHLPDEDPWRGRLLKDVLAARTGRRATADTPAL